MDLTGVDKEVADTFNTALEEAKVVYADSEADEEDVSLAVTNLQNAKYRPSGDQRQQVTTFE